MLFRSGTIIFLVTAFLTFLGNKFFLKRPKIALTIQDDFAGSSTSEKPKNLRIEWNKYFVIKNSTKNSAYNIHFYNLPKNIVLHNHDNINLESFNESKIKFSFLENIEKQKVILSKHNFAELLPNYFKELSFGLEYENENNKKFYTYYQRSNDLEQTKFYFHKVFK